MNDDKGRVWRCVLAMAPLPVAVSVFVGFVPPIDVPTRILALLVCFMAVGSMIFAALKELIQFALEEWLS